MPALAFLVAACGGRQPVGVVVPDRGAPIAGNMASPGRTGVSEAEAVRIRSAVVELALEAMGTPYVWGGTSENGFDCSGLIQYAYRRHGIELPRVSRSQMRAGTAVNRSIEDLKPGDVLGFNAQRGGRITHVGLYLGNNRFIHSSPRGVEQADLTTRYWRQHWVGARRMVP